MPPVTEKYYSGAYWPGRTEPVETYARRGEAFFRLLAPLDPTLATWFEQANSRAMALKRQFVPAVEPLSSLFAKQQYQKGVGALSFAAWNGEEAESSVVRFSCGSPSPYVVDHCVLTPPAQGPAADRLISATVLTEVLRAMVLAWDPEWGIASSTAHRTLVSEYGDPGTFTGWIMYFARSRGEIPPLPAPARLECVGDRGTLVILTPERFTASNPEHLSLSARVHEILHAAGLLRPLQPLPHA